MGTTLKSARRIKPPPLCASDERRPLIRSLASPARRLVPAGARAIADQRRQTLLRFLHLAKFKGQARAARKVGASVTTIWRWRKRFKARGIAGLLTNASNSGRRSPFKQIRLTAAAVRKLEMLFVEHYPNRRAAWRQFANSPACPPLVARALHRSGRVPAALSAIGRVSPVKASVFMAADGGRLFAKLPSRTALTAKLYAPANFNLMEFSK